MKKIFLVTALTLMAYTVFCQNTAWPSPPATAVQNVGIGTTSPVYKLQVVGTTGGSEFITPKLGFVGIDLFNFDSKQMYQNGIQFVNDSWKTDGFTTWLSGWGGLKFFTGSQPRLSITAFGKVGIGTTTPQTDLEVTNSGNTSAIRLSIANGAEGYQGYTTTISNNYNYAEAFSIKHNGAANILKAMGNAQGVEIGNIGTTEGIYLVTGTSSKVSVPNGKLIVGNLNNAATDYKLHVKGNIVAQKVKVTQTDWADYVFDSTYNLMPLNDVADFINLNKHLPYVPSAAAVEKDGIDIGENQATLLRKIEELTLYMIEMNNTIEKQSEIVRKQQTEIKALKLDVSKSKRAR